MNVVFRWFGEQYDHISLDEIRQIPGIDGIVTVLYDIPAGEVWPLEDIKQLKNTVNAYDFSFEVIESVNIHEDIKLGLQTRDKYIENYKETIKNLSKVGVKVICYNFMPIFDWIRTELNMTLDDGSETMFYEHRQLQKITPEKLIEDMLSGSKGFSLPGWEPERLKELEKLFKAYADIDETKLFNNLVYFLEQIMPVCEEYDVKMAIHPDDPPWSLFGLPRIINSKESIMSMFKAVDSEYNGLTLCTGSLGANIDNDLPDMIRTFGSMGRLHFAHIRNLKLIGDRTFYETAHRSEDGSFDMFEIVKALHDIDFKGYVRPDHGRMIWGEKGRPGYGLYDRALGITYLNGLWEAISKMKELNKW
ncbi:MAG: Mannonate dehydratase [Xylanivirga thermophila]|uniref:mannonate dehydratase n=1 Tax=Xylanivirga thermophila TaxID=2496273 RepID=UPI0039F535F3